MDLVLSPSARVAVVTPRGELDLATVDALREVLVRAAATPAGTVVVDLAHVGFCDCTTWTVLLEARARLRRHGRSLLLVNVGPDAARVLDLLGLTGVLRAWPRPAAREAALSRA